MIDEVSSRLVQNVVTNSTAIIDEFSYVKVQDVVTNRRDGDLSFELVDLVYQKEDLFSAKFFTA